MGSRCPITRRLRGLGFHPDGTNRWVRGDAPPDRAYRRHRRYGWGIGRLTVERRPDGLTLFEVTTLYRAARGACRRADVESTVERGLSLPELIALIGQRLDRQRTVGRIPGWWHMPKDRSVK